MFHIFTKKFFATLAKYQSFTEADTKKLTAAGYKGGFTNFVAAVKEYVQFLEGGGYYQLGR